MGDRYSLISFVFFSPSFSRLPYFSPISVGHFMHLSSLPLPYDPSVPLLLEPLLQPPIPLSTPLLIDAIRADLTTLYHLPHKCQQLEALRQADIATYGSLRQARLAACERAIAFFHDQSLPPSPPVSNLNAPLDATSVASSAPYPSASPSSETLFPPFTLEQILCICIGEHTSELMARFAPSPMHPASSLFYWPMTAVHRTTAHFSIRRLRLPRLVLRPLLPPVPTILIPSPARRPLALSLLSPPSPRLLIPFRALPSNPPSIPTLSLISIPCYSLLSLLVPLIPAVQEDDVAQ